VAGSPVVSNGFRGTTSKQTALSEAAIQRTVQFNEESRISRLGAQVVKINADLLHFHSIPSASESRIGGVELVGSRIAAHASTANVTTSKVRFIDVTLFSMSPD
jgi:hypothetical protein